MLSGKSGERNMPAARGNDTRLGWRATSIRQEVDVVSARRVGTVAAGGHNKMPKPPMRR
jgi:hypothetical protein